MKPASLFSASLRRGALIAAMLLSSACSTMRSAYLETLPFEGFVQVPEQPNVRYEAGSEAMARSIAAVYPAAVAAVERSHGAAFDVTPVIYLCASKPCFKRYSMADDASGEIRPRGDVVVLNGPRLARSGNAQAMLTHELSHVYWFARGVRCQPRWWEEGLAVWASDGGGAERTSVADATDSILRGYIVMPVTERRCAARHIASDYQLDWPTSYRQSGMFVEFLARRNPDAFRAVLQRVREKTDVIEAIDVAYRQPVDVLWTQWVRTVKGGSSSGE